MKIINIDIPDKGLVLVSGRPAMGKTQTLLTIANELVEKGEKPVFVFADGRLAHSSYTYRNGENIRKPSELETIKEKFPDVPFVIDDSISKGNSQEQRKFIEEIIEHDKASVILINTIGFPAKKVETDIIKTLKETAKERNVLILCEIGMMRAVELLKSHRPQRKYIMCEKEALSFADDVLLTYRPNCYSQEAPDGIIVYNKNQKTIIK